MKSVNHQDIRNTQTTAEKARIQLSKQQDFLEEMNADQGNEVVQTSDDERLARTFTLAWTTLQPFRKWFAADGHITRKGIFDTLTELRNVQTTWLMKVWQGHKYVAKQSIVTGALINSPVAANRAIIGSMRLLSHIAKLKLSMGIMLMAMLISPAKALDNVIALNPYPGANMIVPDPGPWLPVGLVGTYILVATGLLTTIAKSLLGPLMGISSVLWFIMRNDAAIKPSASWAVFGVWASVTLMYLSYQTRRAMLEKLYILLTLAFSGLCLCIVAVVQKSSIQGGLVTAIPPCVSFGAYAVAFCFPTRRYVPPEVGV